MEKLKQNMNNNMNGKEKPRLSIDLKNPNKVGSNKGPLLYDVISKT